MANYVGYKVKVLMHSGMNLEGTILFVDNLLMKLQNVQTNDPKRGIVKELIIKASDIKDLAILGKDEGSKNENQKETSIPARSTEPSPRKTLSYKEVASNSEGTKKPRNKEEGRSERSTEKEPSPIVPKAFMQNEQVPISSAPAPQPPSEPKAPILDPAIISISAPPGPPRMPPPNHFVPPPFPNPSIAPYPHQLPMPHFPAPPMMFPPHPNMIPMASMAPSHALSQLLKIGIQENRSQSAPGPRRHPDEPPIPMHVPPPMPHHAPPVPPQEPPKHQQDMKYRDPSPGYNQRKSPRRSDSPGRQKSPNRKFYMTNRDRDTFGDHTAAVDDEFDFEGSNSRFNKKKVYKEMLDENDTTDEVVPPSPSSIPKINFKLEDGKRLVAATAEQMKTICAKSQEVGISLSQMVENAGRSTAQFALQMLKGKKDPKIVVLIGVGSNGAIGYCTARHLANHNMNVYICRTRAYHFTDEVALQRKIYQATSGKEAQIGSLSVEAVDLIIDAMVGYGLKGPLQANTLTLTQWANANGAPILALDCPTGVDASTGKVSGEHIKPSITLTFAVPKTGLLKDKTGKLYLADVGIPTSVFTEILGPEHSSPFGENFIVKVLS